MIWQPDLIADHNKCSIFSFVSATIYRIAGNIGGTVETQIAIRNILARFKFGGSVQDRHTYICEEEILADFKLAVGRPTAKPTNFPAIQYLHLPCTYNLLPRPSQLSMLHAEKQEGLVPEVPWPMSSVWRVVEGWKWSVGGQKVSQFQSAVAHDGWKVRLYSV